MQTANFQENSNNRRNCVKNGLIVAITGVTGIALLSGCKDKEEEKEDEGQKVSPPEDLMQEHGLLKRVLLIKEK